MWERFQSIDSLDDSVNDFYSFGNVSVRFKYFLWVVDILIGGFRLPMFEALASRLEFADTWEDQDGKTDRLV